MVGDNGFCDLLDIWMQILFGIDARRSVTDHLGPMQHYPHAWISHMKKNKTTAIYMFEPGLLTTFQVLSSETSCLGALAKKRKICDKDPRVTSYAG